MLSAGHKLGPYELTAPIGEGGMGQVWKARDTRLGRTVAVKVSKSSFDERFEREARAVASLSHPNICTLHDVGPDYLVMEYIDGKPAAGPLPVPTALRYAIEIARALDAAHRVGIVHRDLKPGNILICKTGIKLLDFGLAKRTAGVMAAAEETVTRALTEQGTILGTLQYMPPEQLEGREADARSDIFAFGCVLHEMLTGTPAFPGGSRASIIAAIMDRAPSPIPGVPPALASIVHRCLAKDPDDRWQSARDLVGVLELAAAPSEPASAAPAVRTPNRALAILAALTLIATAAALWFAFHKTPEKSWIGQSLGGPPRAIGPRISPDGHTIAFHHFVDSQTQVAIMKPETGDWTVLTHQRDLGQIADIAWARDGTKLYFDRKTDAAIGIFSVPILGGEPRLVLEAAGAPGVLADGSLVVVRLNAQREGQIYQFWPDSGKIEPLPALSTYNVRPTSDGKTIVFCGTPLDSKGNKGPLGIYTLDPATGRSVNVAPGQVFQAERVVLAPSPDGRSIVYSQFGNGLNSVVSVPRSGSGEMKILFTLTGDPWYLDVSPDGSIYVDQIYHRAVILRYPPSGGVPERLAHGHGDSVGDSLVLVLPDGRPLVYTVAGLRRHFEIVQKDGAMRPLIESSENLGPPAALAGDRHLAVLTDRRPLQIAIVSIADGRIVRRVPLKAESITSLAASPDGQTFYYSSEGFIWSMPAAGGEPRKLSAGDAVSADSDGRSLIVSRQDRDGIRLERLPAAGGTAQPIAFSGPTRLALTRLSTAMTGPGGLIGVITASPNSWSYKAGLIDPRTGALTQIPVQFEGEVFEPTWTRDGKLVSTGLEYLLTLWRFQVAR